MLHVRLPIHNSHKFQKKNITNDLIWQNDTNWDLYIHRLQKYITKEALARAQQHYMNLIGELMGRKIYQTISRTRWIFHVVRTTWHFYLRPIFNNLNWALLVWIILRKTPLRQVTIIRFTVNKLPTSLSFYQ